MFKNDAIHLPKIIAIVLLLAVVVPTIEGLPL